MSTTSYVNDITAETRLVAHNCHDCGVVYGLGAEFLKRRRADQRTFYCPNGHAAYFPKPQRTEEDRLREQLDVVRSLAQRERERRELAERQRAAAKGQVTKLKRRAAHGVCPAQGCKRSFADLGRHMAGQHPEFVAEHGTASVTA